jgi:hypothetical protein
MPSPDARAAFDDAQRLTAQLRDIHAQEHALSSMLKHTGDPATTQRLAGELKMLRRQWADLMAKYTAAMGRFTAAVEKARKG